MDDDPATEPASDPGTQTDAVIRGVREMIWSGEFPAGARLPVEKALAERFSVSRGSLREGIRALAALGVVDSRQGDGTYVTALDPHRLLEPVGLLADLAGDAQARELMAVRRALEAEAASLAATRVTEDQLAELTRLLDDTERLLDEGTLDQRGAVEADARFHRLVAEAGGNGPLSALIEHLGSRTFRARVWRAIDDSGAVRDALAEHRAVLKALQRRDSEHARLRMVVHLLGVEEYMEEHQG